MQPLQCGSQHQLANLQLSTHRTTPEHQMTTVMQPFQCDLPPEIPKHPITTHTQAHRKQLQATVTLRQKKPTNRPQPHPSHTRGTFHRRLLCRLTVAIENCHRNSWFSHQTWWFSIETSKVGRPVGSSVKVHPILVISCDIYEKKRRI